MTYEREESFQPRMLTRELLVDMFRGNPDISVGQTDFEIRVGYDEKINGEIKKLRGFFMPRSRTWPTWSGSPSVATTSNRRGSGRWLNS